MSLVKWNPGTSIFPSISNWMDDFFTEDGFKPMVKGISIPAANITENKTAYKLDIAAPGFKKPDFNVEVKDGYLTISAETQTEKEDKDEKFNRREFQFNSFSRSFALPENVNVNDIKAIYDNGILKVEIPKVKVEKEVVAKLIKVG